MSTDLIITNEAFITPYYRTYVESNKKKFSARELEDSFNLYMNFRKEMEQLGFLSENDEGNPNLAFSVQLEVRKTQRFRSIPVYSSFYVEFLKMDGAYKKRVRSNQVGVTFLTAPLFSFSLGMRTFNQFPFKNNFFMHNAAVAAGFDLKDFSKTGYSSEETLTIMKVLKEHINLEFSKRNHVMSEQNLRDFVSYACFLSTPQTAIKILKISEKKRKEVLDYVVKAIINNVDPLKFMLAFSVSNYSDYVITNQEEFVPVLDVETLIENKDIPATFFQLMFLLNVEEEQEENVEQYY